jgi:integrase
VREISPDEKKAILAALDPQGRHLLVDLRPLVRFLLETGLRLGEACGLKWGDVDFRAEVATLTRTKAGKVQHAYLSAEALDILRSLGAQADDLARRNGKTERNPYVFGWPDGRPLKPNCISHAFRLAAVRAGVPNVHLHDARHTAAGRWLRAGVGIYTVSKLLRHSTVKMSERYAHLDAGDLRAAVNFTSDTPTDTGKNATS